MTAADRRHDWRQRARVALAAGAGRLLVRALASTWRVTIVNDDALRRVRGSGRPVILVHWHGEMLPLLWVHRRERVAILISTHADGEIIARIATGLGYGTVRGSSSRGGARAVLQLVRALEGGQDVALTPDGPRGPRHQFAVGALFVAQRSGAPVLCIRARASRAWTLASWDRFLIPKPFAKVTVRYAEPQYVGGESAHDAEAEVPRFEQLMAALAGPNEPASE